MVIARPAPLTMQPIVPSSLMNVRPASRASRSAGSSSSGSRSASSSGWRASAESSSVTLASRQTSRSTAAPVGVGLADDRQRVDLDEVGVVGEHRPDEALGDRDGGLEVAAEAHREGELARLVVEQAEHRVGVVADDRLGVVDGDLLDLDAALRRAHQQDPPRRPVEDGRHVVLADDVGGRRDEHLADRDALDLHPEDRRRDALRLVRAGGELHAARLAATADEDLRLDDDRRRRRSARIRSAAARAWDGVWATSQAGTGRPWATSSDLASASWIFTRRRAPLAWRCGTAGRLMVAERSRRPDGDDSERTGRSPRHTQ